MCVWLCVWCVVWRVWYVCVWCIHYDVCVYGVVTRILHTLGKTAQVVKETKAKKKHKHVPRHMERMCALQIDIDICNPL